MSPAWPDGAAAVLVTGPWTPMPIQTRLSHAVGRLTPSRWIRALVQDLLARWPVAAPPHDELDSFLRAYPPDDDDRDVALHPPPIIGQPPTVPPSRLHLPMSRILTVPDLLNLLEVTDTELDWFADRQDRLMRDRSAPRVHYRYRTVAGPRGSRLLEIPKPRLREAQRRLLRHVGNRLPLHPNAHGSVIGRSVLTCLAAHTGAAVVIRCDLESFFATISFSRVRGLISGTGADARTAGFIAGLCTTATPYPVRNGLPRPVDEQALPAHWRLRRRLGTAHLPQGAPSSPSLANAIAFSLDHRLALLAASLGARYSRYVDDLIFSGPRGLPVGAMIAGTRVIATDEGFQLAERKTRVLRAARRQQLLGVVINSTPTLARTEIDQLRAIVHNCRTHGVQSQCRDDTPAEFRHRLTGRIAWLNAIDQAKGARLRSAADLIDWDS